MAKASKKAAPKKKKVTKKPAAMHWPVKKVVGLKDAASARLAFDSLKSQGFKPYYVDEKGNPSKPMQKFDELAGGVVFV